MIRPTIETHIRGFADDLRGIDAALDSVTATILSAPLLSALKGVAWVHRVTPEWVRSIRTRDAAWDVLNTLTADPSSEMVSLAGAEVAFADARSLAVQAYLATTWALSDSITTVLGRILCRDGALKPPKKAKITTHFIRDREDAVSSLIRQSSRECFGWAVEISYALRNHFAHDGGHRDGSSFFAAESIESGFAVSVEGLQCIEQAAREAGVQERQTQRDETWPWHKEDLREMMRCCETEHDQALGLLLGTARAALKANVGHLLGNPSTDGA